jgi:hypothetical protein
LYCYLHNLRKNVLMFAIHRVRRWRTRGDIMFLNTRDLAHRIIRESRGLSCAITSIIPRLNEWRKFTDRPDYNLEASPNGRNFASRLASLTARLDYEGFAIFALQMCTLHSSGIVVIGGPEYANSALVIRTIADYEEVSEYFHNDARCENPNCADGPIRHYYVKFVVAPKRLIP